MGASTSIVREDGRKADLAAIHIAKKQLGWDDETYRDILFTVCRVRSSGDLDFTGRKRFLDHLRACGWAGKPNDRSGAPKGTVSKPLTPIQRKIWSLWQQLHDAGLVEDRRMGALQAFVARQTGCQRMEWLKPRQEDLVIESLKRWLARAPGAV